MPGDITPAENATKSTQLRHRGAKDVEKSSKNSSQNDSPHLQGRCLSAEDTIILLAVMYCYFITDGPIKSYGIFYMEYLSLFHQGAGMTSWVAFAFALSTMLTGPVTGVLYDRVDGRLLVVISTLLGTACYIGSAFAVNIQMMICTHGLFYGIACCVNYTTLLTYLNKRLRQRPLLVNGLLQAACSVGGIVIAPLMAVLVTRYTIRGTLLVLAGLYCNQVPAGLLLRPLTNSEETKMAEVTKVDESRQPSAQNDSYRSQLAKEPIGKSQDTSGKVYRSPQEPKFVAPLQSSHIKHQVNIEEYPTPTAGTLKRSTSLPSAEGILKSLANKKFLAVIIFLFCTCFAQQGVLGYLPVYASETGFSTVETSAFLTVFNVSELVFTLTMAFLGEYIKGSKSLILAGIIMVCGLHSIVVPQLTNRITMYIYCAVFGAFSDSSFVFLGTLFHHCVEDRYFGTAFGMANMAYGLGAMVASVLFGYIQEGTGTFCYTFYTAGGIQLLAAIGLVVVWERPFWVPSKNKTYDVK